MSLLFTVFTSCLLIATAIGASPVEYRHHTPSVITSEHSPINYCAAHPIVTGFCTQILATASLGVIIKILRNIAHISSSTPAKENIVLIAASTTICFLMLKIALGNEKESSRTKQFNSGTIMGAYATITSLLMNSIIQSQIFSQS